VSIVVPAQRRPLLPPMLCHGDARLVDRPGPWVWQVKHDGWRCQAHAGTGVLFSRHGRVISPSFPDITEALAQLLDVRDVVLDGELVVLGADGRPDFAALGVRGACGARSAAHAATVTPATLVVFDVLVADGQDVRPRTFSQRRELLEQLGLPTGTGPVVVDDVHTDGPALIRATHELGLEGCVAKRADSRYEGRRSQAWVKVKHAHARDLVASPRAWRRSA
jgi:bifunctional non-homologous end joining protein LigD